MFKKKLFVAGLSAAAITAFAGSVYAAQTFSTPLTSNQGFEQSMSDGDFKAFGNSSFDLNKDNMGTQNEKGLGNNFGSSESFKEFGNTIDNDFAASVDNADENFKMSGGDMNFSKEENSTNTMASPQDGNSKNTMAAPQAGKGTNTMSEEDTKGNAGGTESDSKPVLGRKSDEEAMQEGNPTPELPEGVTLDEDNTLTNQSTGDFSGTENKFQGNESQGEQRGNAVTAPQNGNAGTLSQPQSGNAGTLSQPQSGNTGILSQPQNGNTGTLSQFQNGNTGTMGIPQGENNGNTMAAPKDGTKGNAVGTESDSKPALGRKSDEEAMQEGNPTPELPEGVSLDNNTESL